MNDPRNTIIKVRLTNTETVSLDHRRAQLGGISRAEYLRRFGLEGGGFDDALSETLGRIGLEINRISKKEYRGLPRLCDELSKLVREILSAREGPQ